VRGTSRLRLESLDLGDRDECLRRVRARLATASEKQYVFRGEEVMTTAARPDGPVGSHKRLGGQDRASSDQGLPAPWLI